MADLIKIKRSDATATPVSLVAGELAYSENSGNLFFGRIADGQPIVIGGLTDHNKLAGIESGAQVNTVTSVAGRAGAVVITTADLANFNTAVNALIGATVLDALSDVYIPSTPGDGQALLWDNANSRWHAAALSSGVTAFTQLNDTPNNYSGTGGYIVKVNAGATALEFVAGVDGGTF